MITATEYKTISSVTTPSIVQTLPVHITYTSTKTKGFNGEFTLVDLTPGASTVIPEPIKTATLNLDAAGLDLGNLDLGNIDLTGFTSGLGGGLSQNNNEMIDVLASLLQKYSDDEPTESNRPVGNGKKKSFGKPPRHRTSFDRFRSTNRFSDRKPDFDEPLIPDEIDSPKFEVLGGFTLSDRPRKNDPSGTASTNTRYSKFKKKKDNKLVNNGLGADNESERERERFSASTNRRFLSHSNDRKTPRRPPSKRFQRAQEADYFEESTVTQRPSGTRSNRQANKPNRRPTGKQLSRLANRNRKSGRSIISANRPVSVGPKTVLTLFLPGTAPGQYITTLKTVSLSSLSSSTRVRRNVIEPSPSFQEMSTKSLEPSRVVDLLKHLDKSKVKGMLEGVHKWIDYYIHEVLDESPNDIHNNLVDISDISSSILNRQLFSSRKYSNTEATSPLTVTPSLISQTPTLTSDKSLCPAPQTLTETVYRTVYLPSSEILD